jgi:class 3 adenylate cyclase
VNCPRCQHPNPDDARFCGRCGIGLVRETRCPRCDRPNPDGQRFCHGCGAPFDVRAAPPARALAPGIDDVLRSHAALVGERKQVTVLFADVQGSMDLAGQMDPEDWAGIMRRFFGILSDGVARFDGFVDKFTGDGIMALFGAPIAHEDHALRACWAALHLRDEVGRYGDELRRSAGLNFSARIGLNSGEVVVGRIGDDGRLDYTAQGHTVGLAQRMEALAAPGHVYLTASTRDLVHGYFALRDLGAFQVKGLAAPLGVFALEGPGRLRTRLDRSRERGLTRFVGRGDELGVLESALERARRGAGQAIGVVGEAGVGKSRLCSEFVERCRGRGHEVLEARGVAHGRAIPLLPILELMRQFFGITERDDDRLARERIAGRLLLLDPAFRDDLPVLFDFLGVPDLARPAPRIDADARQRQIFALTRRLIQAPPGAGDPTIVLIEDLHWIDPATEAFVEIMMDAVAPASLVLLWNFRPEYHAGWMSRACYQQIALGPLGREAMRELVADRLGIDPSLDGLADRIEERTRGNPFFAEEVIQSLIESGAIVGERGRCRLTWALAEIEIPAAVQALLAARIDRLAGRDKEVLHTAAVVGKSVPLPVLARCVQVAGDELRAALRALERAELVFEEAVYPEVEYAFRHPLTQEVAYRTQLATQRTAMHERVARAIEALAPPERLDEKAALLAHHWAEAGDPLVAARWQARAADYVAVTAPTEALRHWQRVRTFLAGAAETPETLALRARACAGILGRVYRIGVPHDEQEAIFAEGSDAVRRIGDARGYALLLIGRGSVDVTGDVAGYIRHADEAARVAADVADEGFRYTIESVDPAYSRIYAARLAEVLARAEAAIARGGGRVDLGVDVYGFSPLLCMRLLRAWVLVGLGRLPEAADEVERTIAAARAHGEHEVLTWTYGVDVMLEDATGTLGAGLRHALDAVALSDRIGSSFSRIFALSYLGLAQALRGDATAALASAEQTIALLRAERTALGFEPVAFVRRGEALLALGDVAGAEGAADEAVACARTRGIRLYEPPALVLRAHVALARGPAGATAAARAVADGLAVAHETGGRVWEPRFHEAAAVLAELRGDDAERRRALARARQLYVEIGAAGHASRLAG